MRQEEHNEQVNLMKWWSLAHFKFKIPERCLFAIPNGGQRNVITAKPRPILGGDDAIIQRALYRNEKSKGRSRVKASRGNAQRAF